MTAARHGSEASEYTYVFQLIATAVGGDAGYVLTSTFGPARAQPPAHPS
jgi:hypothetical protein